MADMEKLCRIVEDELHKMADKGLNTSNIDAAYKLADIYKDIKNTEYWDIKSEYYMAVLDEMQGGYSQNDGYSGRKRDSRGRYSRESGRGSDGAAYARRGGYSRRDSYRGNGYSMNDGMNYDRYMDSKESYRSDKSPECKQRLMDTLEEYMGEFSEQLEEMMRDSDCREEKEIITRYLKKLQSM